MIRAVLFDMDGVLLDTETLGFRAMRRIAAEFGYTVDLAFYRTTLGLTNGECYRAYIAGLGEAFPYEEASERFARYFTQYSRARSLPRKPGLTECLEGLRARGIRIALATSTARTLVNEYFASMPDLGPYFNGMVCGGEAPRGKPAPDIYIAAARAVGCAPEECVGVEDSFGGLQAVHASGARCVMIPDLLPYEESFRPYVDDCLAGLGELCPLIDRLNAPG